MNIPVISRYKEDVKNLIEEYDNIRRLHGDWFYDSLILDKTLESPAYKSQPLLRGKKLKRLASHMAESIVNGYGNNGGEFYPFSDLHNILRLRKEKIIGVPKKTLKAIYFLIDDFSKPKGESTYNLQDAAGLMTYLMNAVKGLSLESDFDIRYADRVIEGIRKQEDSPVTERFEKIREEIIEVKNLDTMARAENQLETY